MGIEAVHIYEYLLPASRQSVPYTHTHIYMYVRIQENKRRCLYFFPLCVHSLFSFIALKRRAGAVGSPGAGWCGEALCGEALLKGRGLAHISLYTCTKTKQEENKRRDQTKRELSS